MVPVSGFTGPWPEMNTKSPARTAWEYGPAGAGPFSAITVFLIGSPFLSLCLFSPHKCARFCGFRPVDEDMRDPGEDVREGAIESRVRLLGLIVKAVRGDEISFPPFRLPQSCCLRSRRLRRIRGSHLVHEVQRCSLLPYLPAGRHPRLLHDTILPHQVYLVVQVHRTTDMVGNYLQRVPNFEVAVFVHREHPMLLREPLQDCAGVSDKMAVPLQVQWLRAWGYIGSESLAAAVDYGQVPGRPTHHRAHHHGCAFVERAGTETSLHPIVEHVGSGSDLRHPLHLRHMLRRRSRAHADVVHPYASFPQHDRQGHH